MNCFRSSLMMNGTDILNWTHIYKRVKIHVKKQLRNLRNFFQANNLGRRCRRAPVEMSKIPRCYPLHSYRYDRQLFLFYYQGKLTVTQIFFTHFFVFIYFLPGICDMNGIATVRMRNFYLNIHSISIRQWYRKDLNSNTGIDMLHLQFKKHLSGVISWIIVNRFFVWKLFSMCAHVRLKFTIANQHVQLEKSWLAWKHSIAFERHVWRHCKKHSNPSNCSTGKRIKLQLEKLEELCVLNTPAITTRNLPQWSLTAFILSRKKQKKISSHLRWNI